MASHENPQAERIADPGATSSPPLVSLDLKRPIWERFFTVAPLLIIGTRDETGAVNLAPKHMATPLGWQNYFGFVCTPRHRTYQNIRREGVFTVSFPRPTQVVLTSLSAAPRDDDDVKPAPGALADAAGTDDRRRLRGRWLPVPGMHAGPDRRRILARTASSPAVSWRLKSLKTHCGIPTARTPTWSTPHRSWLTLPRGVTPRFARAHAFPYPVGFLATLIQA